MSQRSSTTGVSSSWKHSDGPPRSRVISAKAGFVFFVQGRVSVEGGPLSTGEHFRQLRNGESLSTQRGRAEVLLNPGVVLRLGDMSRLHMDDVKLTDACVSLESGSAVIAARRNRRSITESSTSTTVTADCSWASGCEAEPCMAPAEVDASRATDT